MGFGTLYRPALADSGWDSDYDSGGSWDSGSDWDSSSSWSSGGSSISGSGGGISLVAVIIVVVMVLATLLSYIMPAGPYTRVDCASG